MKSAPDAPPFRTADRSEGVRFLRWESLSRSTQQRFIEACQRDDVVLLRRISLLERPLSFWLAMGVTALVALGQIRSRFDGESARFGQVSPMEYFLVTLAFGGLLLGVLLAIQSWLLSRRMGVPLGYYLFARDLIEVRGDGLLLIPTTDLERVVVRGRKLLLSFKSSGTIAVPHLEEDPLELEDKIRSTRAEAERWEGTSSAEMYDPLDEERQQRGDTFSSGRRRLPTLFLLALVCTAFSPIFAHATLSKLVFQNDLQFLQEGGGANLSRVRSYWIAAQTRGAKECVALADRVWVNDLYEWNGKGSRAFMVLEYLQLGGKNITEAVNSLLLERSPQGTPEIYERIFEFLKDQHELEAVSLYEYLDRQGSTQVGKVWWFEIHGKYCKIHRNQYLQGTIEQARQKAEVSTLLEMAAKLPRHPEQAAVKFLDLVPEEIAQAASKTLDQIYAQAGDDLRKSALSAPVKEGFEGLLKQARQGKAATLFVGALEPEKSIKLGQSLRATGGPLCNELTRVVLPATVSQALFFELPEVFHHGDSECLLALEEPQDASLVIRCGASASRNDGATFLLDRCQMQFRGNAPITVEARWANPLVFEGWDWTGMSARDYESFRDGTAGVEARERWPLDKSQGAQKFFGQLWKGLSVAQPIAP